MCNAYVTTNLHEAHHHYLKLVSTNLNSYQVLQLSQIAIYWEDQVPEAKFGIDLSPIRVTYRWSHRLWYNYITSLAHGRCLWDIYCDAHSIIIQEEFPTIFLGKDIVKSLILQ